MLNFAIFDDVLNKYARVWAQLLKYMELRPKYLNMELNVFRLRSKDLHRSFLTYYLEVSLSQPQTQPQPQTQSSPFI